MDPYTEYLGMGNVLTRNESSYRVPQPKAARQSRAPRANRWRRRATQR